MSNNSLRGSSIETLLWEGRPDYWSRRILVGVAAAALFWLVAQYLALQGFQGAESAGIVVPIFLLALNLIVPLSYIGTSYRITSQRLETERNLLFLTRKKEISLEAITEVTVKKRSNKGFLKFRTLASQPINFSLLREDPDTIRKIALGAKDNLGINHV